MKFKKFVSEVNLDESKNECIVALEESENALTKLKTLDAVALDINNLTIYDVFSRVKPFLNCTIHDKKIGAIQNDGFNIVKDLEMAIKMLSQIKHKIKTKFLDTLIISSNKLTNNIKNHINQQLDLYKAQ